MAKEVVRGALTEYNAAKTADYQSVAAAEETKFHGIVVEESAVTPAAAQVKVRNGTGDTDPVIANIVLAANEAKDRWHDRGIVATGGIFVEVVAGTVDVSILYSQG